MLSLNFAFSAAKKASSSVQKAHSMATRKEKTQMGPDLKKASLPESRNENTKTSEATTVTSNEKQTTFLLAEKGAFLVMPENFQNIRQEHRKLLRQIQKAKTVSRTESENQFVMNIENFFPLDLRRFPSVCELHNDVRRLENEYRQLCSFMKLELMKKRLEKLSKEAEEAMADEIKCRFDKLNNETKLFEKSKCERFVKLEINEFGIIGQDNKEFSLLCLLFFASSQAMGILDLDMKKLITFCPFADHQHHETFLEVDDRGERFSVSSVDWKTETDGYFTYHDVKVCDYGIILINFERT